MNPLLPKIGVLTTIVVSFMEAASGSATGAIVFWLTLFSAAVMNESDNSRHLSDRHRRWM